ALGGSGVAAPWSIAAGSTNAVTLASGQTIAVSQLPCFGTTGLQLANGGTAATIGAPFSGFLWLNYTTASGIPGGTNPWYTVKAATITVKVV
ncbi:MAG: hypothetical protein ACHQX1_03470, partial [Candidatus Micrarchaeales archaeon]